MMEVASLSKSVLRCWLWVNLQCPRQTQIFFEPVYALEMKRMFLFAVLTRPKVDILFIFKTDYFRKIKFLFSDLKRDCKNHKGHSGFCVKITSCPEINKILKNPILTSENRSFIRSNQCGFIENTQQVCCTFESEPIETQETQSSDWLEVLLKNVPQPPHCGVQLISRIFGGEETEIGEFPWLALLEYEDRKFL